VPTPPAPSPIPPRPASGAAPFLADELFFSRTDPRGVILAANPVFERVCAYSWAQLEGAPHRIIRHPDMPRGVFWLLWDTLKAGRPIGAYVKNLARDGLHYWVFATVSPVDGGYLSIRLKPVTDLHPAVEAEYAALRARETAEALAPEASAQLLLARLAALGFPDYDAFMAHALAQELAPRPGLTGRGPGRALAALHEALALSLRLDRDVAALSHHLDALRHTPVNMRLMALRLEGSNGPISLMAQNYTTVLTEARDWIDAAADPARGDLTAIGQAIRTGTFDLGVSLVQRAAIARFRAEIATATDPDLRRRAAEECARLEAAAERMEAPCRDSLALIRGRTRRLAGVVRDIRRQCTGLNATRLMCKAEAARTSASATFAAIIDTLDEAQARIDSSCEAILDTSQALRHKIEVGAGEDPGDVPARRRAHCVG
jgi:aerotaxis receptor